MGSNPSGLTLAKEMEGPSMDDQHLKMSDKAAPIVFTYRRVLRRPTVEIEHRFVGFYRFLKNAVIKLHDLVDELAFEEKRNVTDPGESQAVHWALQVRDPFDSEGTAEVVAFKTPGYRPSAGWHFEVFSMDEGQPKPSPAEVHTNGTYRRSSSPAYDRVRESLYGPDSDPGAPNGEAGK